MCVSLSVLPGIEKFDDAFAGFCPVGGIVRPVVELVRDRVEVVLAVCGQVSDLDVLVLVQITLRPPCLTSFGLRAVPIRQRPLFAAA